MTAPDTSGKTRTEEHRINGDDLVARIKEIVREGNARRIIIKAEDGHTLLEIPLTVGVVGAMLMPVWVAVGAIAALAVRFTIVVVKDEKPSPQT